MYCVVFLFGDMTGVLTEDTSKALSNAQLVDLFLKMQNQTNSTIVSLMAEMKDLSSSFKSLESDIQIVETVNKNLLKQLENTERQCWANAQYSRRECVEVISIPKTVESKDLEHTVCKVFNSIGFDIEEDRIEACHRLTKSDRTIFKFSRRKDCQHLMHNKKGLKDFNSTKLSFSEGTKIYVNDSLCPYYRGLWNECNKFWNNKKIYSYFTVNGTVRIKQVEKGPCKSITLINDLRALFPEEQISMSWVV